MNQESLHVVVVGGGTAGWMSALYLHKTLSRATRRAVRVTLVEAEDVPIIGVGEATIPSITAMLLSLGVPEWRLFSEADATFKNAIKFVDWGHAPVAGEPSHAFYHQFDPPPVLGGHSAMVHWLALRNAGIQVAPLDETTSLGSALCDGNRSPKVFSSGPYEAPVPYAYHLDAVKLGILLRTLALEAGVERIVDRVTTVDLDDAGDIAAIQTAGGLDIEGDLFVDCSGFAALLIEGALQSPFESYADRLLCDRAVALQVPHDPAVDAPRCYTTATAKPAGWIWEIDLSTRTGAGYVFSSRHANDDDAKRTLREHLGSRADGLEPRVIPMKVGRRRDPWVGNCVAIGLSAGFLEPLESTGIHLIELGLRVFVDHFAQGEAAVPLRAQYNSLMRDTYEEIADFLVMHYIFNERRGEPFWDEYRERVALPPSLVRKLRLWAYKVPSLSDLASKINVFDGFSYFAVLAGMNTLPPFGGNLSTLVDLTESAAILDEIVNRRGIALRASPPHADMVQKLRASAG